MKKNIIVGQSGGPTAVINSSLYALVKEGLNHPQEIENVCLEISHCACKISIILRFLVHLQESREHENL